MKKILTDWRLHWFLLLLPVALFLPALPIDETRYLGVAWEMRLHGDYLLLHLNGAPYSEKGPLLFWLINLSWLFAGLHVWIVRIGILVTSLASLLLFERLALRLGGSTANADERTSASRNSTIALRATVLLSGILYFALFSSAIMFDVLLTTCVLVALHGVLDIDAGRWRRGTLILALGLGLGLLNKGPVVLLDAGLVALLAPWWSETARIHKTRWYVCILLGVVGSIVIALSWAIPAAIHGGPEYANAIFVRQTVGRVAKSFAHARPLWWYFAVLPLMVLPWTLTLRASWRTWRDQLFADKAARFGVSWFVPALLVFSLFSGKQPHYLLPLMPGLALYLAHVMSEESARVRGRLFGALLLLVGLALFALPFVALHVAAWPSLRQMISEDNLPAVDVLRGIWPLWGALVALLGVFVLAHPRVHAQLRSMALSSTAAATLCMLLLAQGIGPTIDVRGTAARIKAAQDAGKPIAHLAWHHGLFEFAGRLTQPLEKVNFADLYTWCAAHPDGEVVSIYTKYPISAKPESEIPYRLGRILFWRSADLCTTPHLAPPAKSDDDDSTDD
jgi:4-amino-4-deoxy-L-arabinose transferase-like glycosyltransferase